MFIFIFLLVSRSFEKCHITDDVTFTYRGASLTSWWGSSRGHLTTVQVLWTDYEMALVYWCTNVPKVILKKLQEVLQVLLT